MSALGFETLTIFDFDNDQLYKDWSRLSSMVLHTKDRYARTAINQSSLQGNIKNSTAFVSETSMDANDVKFPLESFSAKTIRPEFIGTYTADVVADVEQWLNVHRGLRSTRIKYALLKAGCVRRVHIDAGYGWRYHLMIRTNPDVAMTVENTRYPMVDPGGFYAMLASVPHYPENVGSTDRLIITFDVAPLTNK